MGLRDTLCTGDGASEPLCSGRSSVPGKHSSQHWERSEKASPSRGKPGWGVALPKRRENFSKVGWGLLFGW